MQIKMINERRKSYRPQQLYTRHSQTGRHIFRQTGRQTDR